MSPASKRCKLYYNKTSQPQNGWKGQIFTNGRAGRWERTLRCWRPWLLVLAGETPTGALGSAAACLQGKTFQRTCLTTRQWIHILIFPPIKRQLKWMRSTWLNLKNDGGTASCKPLIKAVKAHKIPRCCPRIWTCAGGLNHTTAGYPPTFDTPGEHWEDTRAWSSL